MTAPLARAPLPGKLRDAGVVGSFEICWTGSLEECNLASGRRPEEEGEDGPKTLSESIRGGGIAPRTFSQAWRSTFYRARPSGCRVKREIDLPEDARRKLAFIMERIHEKLPDANHEILAAHAVPLMGEMDKMLASGIPQHDIGARVIVDKDDRIKVALCNHNSGCDCGEHPERFA
jgi:hypothetical protein